MNKKLIIIVMTFLMAIGLFVNISNAYTLNELQNMAHSNIEEFFNIDSREITNITNIAVIDRGEKCRAAYCLNHNAKGNGTSYRTAVVDVGRKFVNQVESYGEYGYTDLIAGDPNHPGAELAMQLLYLTSMCYQNRETVNGTISSPYKFATLYFASEYANIIKNDRLFNSGLDYNPGEMTINKLFLLGQGGLQNHVTVRNMTAYTNAIKELKFADKSEKDKQTIKQIDDRVFIGPYKIENKGNNPSVGLDTYITSVQAIDKSGEKQYKPDGWASSIDVNSIHGWETFKAR